MNALDLHSIFFVCIADTVEVDKSVIFVVK